MADDARSNGRYGSLEEILLVPAADFFADHPDVTGYFRGGFGPKRGFVPGSEVEFDELLPLRALETPDFSGDALPKVPGEFAEALATSLQVPRAFAGAGVLAMLSVASLRKWKVRVLEDGDWSEFLPLWIVPLLKSGERKTAVLKALLEVVDEWLKEKNKETLRDRMANRSRKEALLKRADNLQKEAAKADDVAERERLMSDAADAAVQASETEVGAELRMYLGDATGEGLSRELNRQNGRMSIVTDEGSQFKNIAGKYAADQTPDVEVLNKGTHGGTADSIRASSENFAVRDPEIAMLQAVQPAVLFGLRNAHLLKGQGFFARCYPVLPESLVGYRDERPKRVPREVREAYHGMMRVLLGVEERDHDGHRTIGVSEGADAWVYKLQQWVERGCRPGGVYSDLLEWISKFVGYVVRIAALMELAEWASKSEGERGSAEDLMVGEETMKNAIRIGFFFLEHARAVFGTIEKSEAWLDAEFLSKVLRDIPDATISRRELHRKVKASFEKASDLDPALELLESRNYLRVQRTQADEDGGRPSVLVHVNPEAKLGKPTDYETVPVATSAVDPSQDFFDWAAGRDGPPPSEPEEDPDGGPKGPKPDEGPRDKTDFGAKTPSPRGGKVVTITDARASRGRKDPLPDAPRVVETPGALAATIAEISAADRAALDLETMPPEGWLREVVGAYRKWRRFNPQGNPRKKPPKEGAKRKRWEELKEGARKKGATDVAGARVRLVSLATDEGLNVVVDATKGDLLPLLEALEHKTLITHNGGFDLRVLRARYGYVHEGRVLDTQRLYVLHHHAEDGQRSELSGGKRRLQDPTKVKGMTTLATLAKKYLGLELDKGDQGSDWSIPTLSASQVAYSLEDSRVLLELSRVLVGRLTALGMARIVELESRAFPARVDMELNGFPADASVAEEMAEKYLEESEEALDKVRALLPKPEAPDGREWNWDVAEHVRAVLRMLGADVDHENYPKTGTTREPSTAKGALTTIKEPERAVEWVGAYLEYLSLHKLHRDFASKYGALIRDGAIRGRYGETSTGRYWCERPNLQQVPARGEVQTLEGMRIRDIFRAPPGETFVVADFKQVELLLAATIAAWETGMEPTMLNVFREGKHDIHALTAAAMMEKPIEEVTKDERTRGKAVNFGMLYGAKAERLKEQARTDYKVDMTIGQATKYREAFFERYPEIRRWHDLVDERCSRGEEFSTTPLGRRRKLPKWASSGAIASTTGKNSPVQGAGADAIKLAMARMFEDRRNCPGEPRLRCSVHDEVVSSVRKEHAEAAAAWVAGHMAAAEREAVGDPESPIVTDIEVRDRW